MTTVLLGHSQATQYRAMTRADVDPLDRTALEAACGWDSESASTSESSKNLSDEDLREHLMGQTVVTGVYPDSVVTRISVSPDSTPMQAIDEISRIWNITDSGDVPDWIECDDAEFSIALRYSLGWNDVVVGAPKDVEDTHYSPDGPPGFGHRVIWPLLAPFMMTLWFACIFMLTRFQLRTSAGIDHSSRVQFDTASTGTGIYAPGNWIALTENSAAPLASDTALAGELTDTGLTRQQASYSHTNGTNTVILTKTFTHGGATTRNVAKAGLFNASTVGTMIFETLVTPTANIATNDQITPTWTLTVG